MNPKVDKDIYKNSSGNDFYFHTINIISQYKYIKFLFDFLKNPLAIYNLNTFLNQIVLDIVGTQLFLQSLKI